MKKPLHRSLRALVAAAVLTGCVPPEPPKAPPPRPKPPAPASIVSAAPAVPERESPPESGPARELSLPAPLWDELPNGLKVATIVSPALPIVQIRVVALGGSAADGDKPGVAAITGELLKDGGAGALSSREVVSRVESLGATLDIATTLDRTALSLAVTKDHLAEALELVATVAQKPAMSPSEFAKLKKRVSDAAADRARSDGAWAAQVMLYRSLFGGAAGHPYATFSATAADLGKLTVNDCRAFHKKLFVPKNMFVVVAGDVAHDAVKAAMDKAFGGATGGEPVALAFPAAAVSDHLQITLVDRKNSTQSDVFAGVLGPERTSPSWPAFAAANQILGGSGAGRLFLEVRERDSLAYRTNSVFHELAHGPSILAVYAGTQSSKTGLAVKSVLDQIERLGTTEPAADELSTAIRFLADVSAIRLETVGALANDLVKNRTLGLPDDYTVRYRRELREVKAGDAARAAAAHARTAHTALVVVGDAKLIGPMLSRFGEVKVVDPMKGFAPIETIAKNPEAALEVSAEAGK